jgi:hypothetical protein
MSFTTQQQVIFLLGQGQHLPAAIIGSKTPVGAGQELTLIPEALLGLALIQRS